MHVALLVGQVLQYKQKVGEMEDEIIHLKSQNRQAVRPPRIDLNVVTCCMSLCGDKVARFVIVVGPTV